MDEQEVYYVHEGRMCSSRIIGSVDIQVDVARNIVKHEDVLAAVLGVENPYVAKNVNKLINNPGIWHYLTGGHVVHDDDCFNTREEAAEAYKQKLLSD